MSDLSVVSNILQQVDVVSKTFVSGEYQALANYMKPVIYALYGLIVTILGLQIQMGYSDLSVEPFIERALKAGLITMLALNWGYFSEHVCKLFVDAPNEIAMQIVSHFSSSDNKDIHSITIALDKFFKEGMQLSSQLWDMGSFSNYMPCVISGFTLLLIIALTGLALLDLIIVKVCLNLFLILAPIMIPAYFFQPTKGLLFDGWLSGLTGFALMPIFIYSSLAFCLLLLHTAGIQPDLTHQLGLVDVAPFIIYLVVAIGLLMKSTQMATAIAGSFSASGMKKATQLAAKGLKSMGRYLVREKKLENQQRKKEKNDDKP